MENNNLTIRDITDAQGLFENYIVTSNKLIAFIEVEALNLDLEDDYMVKSVIDSYSAYLLTMKSSNESFMNISMTSKNDTEMYELYLKKLYMDVDNREDIDETAKDNIRQLIASKILNLEEQTQRNESVKKQHFMAIGQVVSRKEYENYKEAANTLTDKCNQMINEMKEWLRNLNRDLEIKITDNQETLKIFQHFTDNKAALLS